MTSRFALETDSDGIERVIGTYDDAGKINLLSLIGAEQLRGMGLTVATRFRPEYAPDFVVFGDHNQIVKLTPIPNTRWFYDPNGLVVDMVPSEDGTYSNIQIIDIPHRCPYQFTEGPFNTFQCWRPGFGDHTHLDAVLPAVPIKMTRYPGYLDAVPTPMISCSELLRKQQDYLRVVRDNIVQHCLQQLETQIPRFAGFNILQFLYTKPAECPLSNEEVRNILLDYFATQSFTRADGSKQEKTSVRIENATAGPLRIAIRSEMEEIPTSCTASTGCCPTMPLLH